MEKIDFNKNWIFKNLQTGEQKIVSIPHDAMLSEARSESNPGKGHISWFSGGVYEYRKQFLIPEEDREKELIFEFEGIYRNALVYINGTEAANHPNGYTSLYIDATKYLIRDAVNEIKVIVHNEDQPNSRWYTGSGIYRPVWLYSSGAKHILQNGIRIRTVSIHPAVIEVSVAATEAGEAEIDILKGEKVIQTALIRTNEPDGIRMEIEDAKLWNCESPYLYQCRVKFAEDTVVETFGIRTLEVSKDKGLLINDKRVILRGACIHHDNGILGACCYPEAEERKIRLLKSNGYNAIRSAHNPCSKALLDACDRLGMLVMDEYVDVWYIHKTKYDYVDYFDQWWKQDLKDMVEKDFNHPSVILYSTGNEVAETAQDRGIKLTGQMTEYLHSLDDTRMVTCGINIFFNLLSSMGFGVYSDQKAEKESSRPQKEKAVGSEFYNKLAGLLGDRVMKLGATLHGCDVRTRDAFANMDIAGYNYGILRYKKDLRRYPDRLILGTETFCKDAAVFWDFAKENPRILGDFVWAGMDYLGEVGIGSWEYEEYAPSFSFGPGWISAGSGRIDLIGTPLAEAEYTKVAFEQTSRPVIAVKPMQHKGKHSPSAWKMTNARCSWTWEGCEGKTAEIEVYARGYTAELLLNDHSLGKKKIGKSCRTGFKTVYTPGRLTAVIYDRQSRELARTELTTAQKETVISILPEKTEGTTGEIIFIPIRYTDAKGTVKLVRRGTLSINVHGAELLALGNACPYNSRGYLQDSTETYYGEAMAVVRLTEEGTVQITAEDGQLEQKAELTCRIRQEKNRLRQI